MSGMKNYRELDAWQLAMTLVETTYALTRLFPGSERFNLSFQMQKCATSIPSNIAEGQARGTVKFGLFFLRAAIGSAAARCRRTDTRARPRSIRRPSVGA